MFVRSSVLAAAAVAATLLTFGAAVPAVAQPAPAVEVSYGDLDLRVDAGRDVLDRRIADAAAQLCGSFRPVELTWAAAVLACRTETIALTQPQRNAAIGRRGTVEVAQSASILRVSRAAN